MALVATVLSKEILVFEYKFFQLKRSCKSASLVVMGVTVALWLSAIYVVKTMAEQK